MIFSLFGKTPSPIPRKLYDGVIAASRRPLFYTHFSVPDTTQGRFEMVVLHACLLLRHSRKHPELASLAQDFVDTLFEDLDRNLREMGVGDMSVPRRMKKLASAVYGRFTAYDTAFAHADTVQLGESLARNIGLSDPLSDGAKLAAYVSAADNHLAETFDPALFLEGNISFLALQPA